MKKAKITVEFDGVTQVWETETLRIHQDRNVKRKPDPEDPSKFKFEPGPAVMTIIAFEPRLIVEECSSGSRLSVDGDEKEKES